MCGGTSLLLQISNDCATYCYICRHIAQNRTKQHMIRHEREHVYNKSSGCPNQNNPAHQQEHQSEGLASLKSHQSCSACMTRTPPENRRRLTGGAVRPREGILRHTLKRSKTPHVVVMYQDVWPILPWEIHHRNACRHPWRGARGKREFYPGMAVHASSFNIVQCRTWKNGNRICRHQG